MKKEGKANFWMHGIKQQLEMLGMGDSLVKVKVNISVFK
jgi:hypothetical protein